MASVAMRRVQTDASRAIPYPPPRARPATLAQSIAIAVDLQLFYPSADLPVCRFPERA